MMNGYYGKVSTYGDFVSRGLPSSFIEPWDAWLQEAIFCSQQQLGDEWLNCYLTGPIYRFSLAPGVCGENSWLGVMIPSVDRIGRYYPMIIATMNSLSDNPLLAIQEQEMWFVKAEQLALSSLADDFSLEQFNVELNQLEANILSNKNKPINGLQHVAKQSSSHAWQKSMQDYQKVSDMFPSFLNDFLKDHYFSYSVWWTQGSELVAPSVLICEGLPPFEGMAAMIDGNWTKWGWEGNRYPFGEQDRDELLR